MKRHWIENNRRIIALPSRQDLTTKTKTQLILPRSKGRGFSLHSDKANMRSDDGCSALPERPRLDHCRAPGRP